MGKLYVNRDPNHRGVWNYFWWPNKNVTEESLAPLQTLHTDVDKHVIKYLTKAQTNFKFSNGSGYCI